MVILDLGCLRGVCGAPWAQREVARLQAAGRYVEITPGKEHFRFGDGQVRESSYRITLEACLAGHLAEIRLSVVAADCPPLMSR
eukprot:102297-Alexandrium_andersonii.AAC.1